MRFYSKCNLLHFRVLQSPPSVVVVVVVVVVCVLCVIACHFFLGAPRAFKFGTWDPWDIFSNYFFIFFKFSKLTPPGQFLTFFDLLS